MHDGRSWPADKVERRDIETLIPYARNSRTHSDEQITQIAASIKEWGFTNPILVDSQNEIIAGHGRLLAAKKLNLKDVPCIQADDWTDAQKQAYVIADNKLALNAGWDEELLKIEFKELTDLNFDVELTGFSLEELGTLFDERNDDKLPEQEQLNSTFEVAVECVDENDQEKVYNLLNAEGYKCRILTM
tara:strand:- start:4129 stop:4695 length:567 start_codon:yes stop_codon:yes gene_type:complete